MIGLYCSHNAYFGGAAAAPVDSNAILADHMFTVPKGGVSPAGFQLQSNSPCLNAGLVMTNNGGRDFWGKPVSSTVAPNVGAYCGRGAHEGELLANGIPTVGPVFQKTNAGVPK